MCVCAGGARPGVGAVCFLVGRNSFNRFVEGWVIMVCTTILHRFVGLQFLFPSFSFCRCHWDLGFLSLDQDLALFVAMWNKKQARRQLE